ncbi:conserved hypothetical protein [Candidatus Desulfosporosinus infrequens]|uniref:N-acetyltransferase domain-containing protein n=1 Tax=Candidatus Desulfosporosinus infrequens TaxID=2043169 RepID=A0A2U3LWK6_9FIRM|nr:conserved hypothetical protein [Candidatus Desulfosporosinus infrequens]
MNIKVERTSTENADFKILEKKLDEELYTIYGDIQKKSFSPYNIVKDLRTIIIYDTNNPIASGCLKFIDNDLAELKRMFVTPENRGKGISKRVIKELEKWAIDCNIKTLVLQTGVKQNVAINLYMTMGYVKIENFEPYVTDTNSICMKKDLL